MKEYIEDRVRAVAAYILVTGATVRQTAKKFKISKSTVHKDATDRIEEIDPQTAKKVRKILEKNMSERHIRGGLATKFKYAAKHKKTAG